MTADSDNSRYEAILRTRDDYIARQRHASETIETVLLSGAAGSLALSVTFIEKLAPHPRRETLLLLGAGWALLFVSLAGSLYSYIVRSRAYERARIALDKAIQSDELSVTANESANRHLWDVLYFRAASLVLGVGFLVIFAFRNVDPSPPAEERRVTMFAPDEKKPAPSPPRPREPVFPRTPPDPLTRTETVPPPPPPIRDPR